MDQRIDYKGNYKNKKNENEKHNVPQLMGEAKKVQMGILIAINIFIKKQESS